MSDDILPAGRLVQRALEALDSSLRAELAPFGVSVTVSEFTSISPVDGTRRSSACLIFLHVPTATQLLRHWPGLSYHRLDLEGGRRVAGQLAQAVSHAKRAARRLNRPFRLPVTTGAKR